MNLTIALTTLLLCSACAFSQHIPNEVLFGNPEKLSPALSPDGSRLAYLAPDENNVMNVWVRDLASSKEEKITSDEKRGIRIFFWRFDGKSILYIQDKDGDENWHLYQTHLETKITRCLTPFEGVQASLLAHGPEFPNRILIQMNKENRGLFDVYSVDLETGDLNRVVENTTGTLQWVADRNLNVRASSAFGPEGETIVRAKVGEEWRELMRWSAEEFGVLFSFSPDGKFLYVVSNVDANVTRLLKVNIADGSKEVVVEDPDYDVLGDHGCQVLFHPQTHALQAVTVNRNKHEWIILDPTIEADLALLKKENETFHIVSRNLKDTHWIIQHTSDLHAGKYFIYDRSLKKTTFLFSSKPQVEKYPLSSMKPVTFKARDGMTLHGYLTLPHGKEPKNLSSVLWVHGGPWARDIWGYNPIVQWFANRGYAVLQVNFRGSTGYGKEYLNAGNREWAGKMHCDIIDGKNWLIDQGIAKADRVAIAGGSYGGFETLVGLTFTPKEFCCGIDIVGPSNIATLIETAPPYWGPFMSIFNVRVGNLQTEREFLESRSPLFKADQICRPLLIIQGANDPRVKQSESDQIVDAIRKNGKEVEYVVIADEGHGFARPENMILFANEVENFLNKHMKVEVLK